MLRKKTGRVLAWVMSFTMLLSLTVVPVSATEITGDTDVVEAVMEDVIVEDETTAMEAESDAEETNVSEAEDDTGANTVSKTENLTDETTGQDESAVDETEGTTAVSTEEIFDDKTNDLTETEISVVEEETEETFTVESIETVAESESTVTETVQAQIDVLPTVDEVAVMDLNGQNEVYAAFLAACEAYDALSENEQAQVDDAALYELSDYFNGLITVATDTFQIGDTIYASWSDAIAAATDGATIILLRSVTYSSSSVLTVTAGKNVILDLNGYTLSKTYSETSTSSLITNNGTLTIKDSSEDKTGTISVIASNTSTISSAGVFLAAIRNAGILNLNGGTIKASTKSTSSKMLLWCVVNTTSNAGVVLDGASIVVEKTSTYYSSYGIYNNADNTSIEVKSGSISVSSPASASTAGIGTNTGCSSSSITMSGGTIEVNCTRDSNIATAYYGILAESGSTTVTGGEIKLHSKGGAYGIKANEDNPAVVNDLTMNVSTETTSSSLSYYLMQYAYIYDGTYTMTDATNLSAAVGEGVIATGGALIQMISLLFSTKKVGGGLQKVTLT